MPREFPIVRGFTVPRLGLGFKDRRLARPGEEDLAREGFQRETVRAWIKGRSHSVVRRECGEVNWIKEEISRRWDEYSKTPGATYEAFEQTGATVLDETCEDPRLPQVRLLAMFRGKVVGMVNLQNCVVLEETRRLISIRCMPMAGFPPPPGRPVPEGWGVFSRYLLENDLQLEDGRVISVDEIFIPDDEDSNSRPELNNGMAEMLAEISSAGSTKTEGKFIGVPKVVRAKRRPGSLNGGDRAPR